MKCRHPAVIQVYLFNRIVNETENKCAIVLELSSIGDLEKLVSKWILQNKKFDEKTIRRWMRQLIEALMYIHSKSAMHRDIKPNNILLFGDLNNIDLVDVKLSDFGSGVVQDDTFIKK